MTGIAAVDLSKLNMKRLACITWSLVFAALTSCAQTDTILTLWSEPNSKGIAQHFTEPVLHRILAGDLQDHVGSLKLAADYLAVFTEFDEGGAGPFFTVRSDEGVRSIGSGGRSASQAFCFDFASGTRRGRVEGAAQGQIFQYHVVSPMYRLHLIREMIYEVLRRLVDRPWFTQYDQSHKPPLLKTPPDR